MHRTQRTVIILRTGYVSKRGVGKDCVLHQCRYWSLPRTENTERPKGASRHCPQHTGFFPRERFEHLTDFKLFIDKQTSIVLYFTTTDVVRQTLQRHTM